MALPVQHSLRPQAERRVAATTVDHEYLPIDGLKEFTSAAAALLFGRQAAAIRENRVRGHVRTRGPLAV